MSKNFDLFKSLLKISLVGLSVGILFTGCVSGAGATPSELVKRDYTPYTAVDKIKLSKAKVTLDNGTVELSNGETIMDEDGDIIFASNIDNEIFYVVYNYDNHNVILKNSSGKIIKKFGKSFRNVFFKNNNKIYIGLATKTDAKIYRNVYSNVYEFNGVKAKLKFKNHVIPGKLVGKTFIVPEYTGDGKNISDYSFYDVFLKKNVKVKPFLVPIDGYTFLGSKLGYHFRSVLGKVGNTVVYVYQYKYDTANGSNREYILEAQNLLTGKTAILLEVSNYTKGFSFLTNGEDVVFKTKDRTIDIRTLKSAIIDENFKPVIIRDSDMRSYRKVSDRGILKFSYN